MNPPESHTRRKWRELVERQQAGGLSVAAFCARHGIAVSSLYAWRRRLAAAPLFVEAKVADVPAGMRSTGMIEVRLRGGRRLLVRREGFDRALLVEVVAALESVPRGVEASS
jgi:transposase-like protein